MAIAETGGAGQAVRIFIGGDKSQVGKSSCCLGLLAALHRRYGADRVAYIKPATQCESPQLVTKFCASRGIACVGIGPVVYYAGFTRAYLAGETATSVQMLAEVRAACDALGAGRAALVVDGVGYPAVGSITASRFGPPGTVLGAREIFTVVNPYRKFRKIWPQE